MVTHLNRCFFITLPLIRNENSIQNTKLRKTIICKTKRSDWGLGGGQNYNRIQTGGYGDGDNIVGMGTKYFTVSSSSYCTHVGSTKIRIEQE